MSASSTIGALYQHLTDELAAAGIEEPRLEARMLMAHAAGIDQTRIIGHPEDEITAETAAHLQELIKRRKKSEPIAYITGTKEFWSLDFKVSRETLIPRPDSETLISAVLETIPDKKAALSILDLGTGSGCLLLALLSELPNAHGLGIDINPNACLIAAENAEILDLAKRARFVEGNWMTDIKDRFDVIVSNPPYIVETEIETLEPDVALFEPHLALSGGVDGLTAYRTIAEQSRPHLSQDGLLAVEIGLGQAFDIKEIFTKYNFKECSTHRDIAYGERCILATV